MPSSSEKLFKMFNTEKISWQEVGKHSSSRKNRSHNQCKFWLLFSKIEDETIDFQIQKLENTKKSNEKTNPKANPMKEEITFDDFTKVDLRTATILRS